MRKILFITHDTTRTGAPLVLLYFLQWLKQNHKEIDITLLSLKGGGLTGEFKEVADDYYNLSDLDVPLDFFKRQRKRVYKRIGFDPKKIDPKELFFKNLAAQEFDLIYANTVLSIPVAHKVKILKPKCSLIVHVHELETIIQHSLPDLGKYIQEIDFFIVVSDLVKRNLVKNHTISPKKIEVIYAFTHLKKEVKKKVDDYFIVGGAGTVNWPKGYEFYIQTAYFLKTNYPELNIKFKWLGSLSPLSKLIINRDLEKAGLQEMVSFMGEQENPEEHFINFDVFLLTSREESFSLVCIEAAMLAKPLICFEGVSGASEIIKKEGGGKTVPYMDIQALAESVVDYYKNRENLVKDGRKAKELFSSLNPSEQAPKIFELIKTSEQKKIKNSI